MEPAQVKVPLGAVYIVVDNQSTARDLQLSLDVEKGKQLRAVSLPRSKRTSHELYNLTPGTYILSETSHPNWTCRIVVTPN